MEEPHFRGLLEDHLLPMFPGITLKRSQDSTSRHHLAAFGGPRIILVKPSANADFRVPVFRRQKFGTEELGIFQAFMREVAEIDLALPPQYFDALLAALPIHAIARYLDWGIAKSAIAEAIQQLDSLAAQTYEGRPIVTAIGVTGSNAYTGVWLRDLWEEDFARVLSNGLDTLYLSSSNRRTFNIKALAPRTASSFAPHRLGAIAHWASKSRKVALALNRNGEILIFRNEKLAFAKRRGKWVYFPHQSVVSHLGSGTSKALREEVYKSAIDASFARTGACICLVRKNQSSRVSNYVKEDDLLKLRKTPKTELLGRALGKKFQHLDRSLRQELLAIDGATIINHQGELLAVGAIVGVRGGSEGGGGRRAAARALSNLGVALKVSADGPITVFKNREEILLVGGRR